MSGSRVNKTVPCLSSTEGGLAAHTNKARSGASPSSTNEQVWGTTVNNTQRDIKLKWLTRRLVERLAQIDGLRLQRRRLTVNETDWMGDLIKQRDAIQSHINHIDV